MKIRKSFTNELLKAFRNYVLDNLKSVFLHWNKLNDQVSGTGSEKKMFLDALASLWYFSNSLKLSENLDLQNPGIL